MRTMKGKYLHLLIGIQRESVHGIYGII